MASDPAPNPFEAYGLYRAAGWLGTLPIPYKEKTYPPSGFTGETGKFPTDAQCAAWLSERTRWNIALRVPQGLVGIDIDQYVKDGKQKRGADNLRAMAEREGLNPLPATWSSTRRDPDGPARICWFRVPKGVKFDGQPVVDVEIVQHGHRYAMVWPSVVPGDEPGEWTQYAWYDPAGAESARIPGPDEMPWLPADWVEALREADHQPGHGSPTGGKSTASLAELLALPADDPARGNGWLSKVAGHLARLHEGDRDTYWARLEEADQVSENPHSPTDFRKTANSIWKIHEKSREIRKMTTQLPADDGTSPQMSHLGVARVFEEKHGQEFRHSPGLGWLAWDGRRWKYDEKKPKQKVHEITDDLLNDIGSLAQGNASAALGWSQFLLDKCQSNSGINSIVSITGSLASVHVDEYEIDADPYKLLVGNGVVNLKTGELMPNDPRHLLMHGTNVDYDPRAECPMWLDFLAWAFNGNLDMIEYIQDMFGTILIGNNRHQVAFFLYGPGQSGKSTIANVAHRLVGDYAIQSELSVFSDSNNGHNDALAQLANKRLAIFSETEEGRSMNESMFKKFTGETTLTASFKGKTGFTFDVKFTPLITGNHRPAVKFDSGVKRRIKVIEFMNVISDADKDPDLVEKMFANEGPGILAWAVQGAVRMANARTVEDPPEVKEAVERYAAENDHLGHFLRDSLEFVEGQFMTSKELWAIYQVWLDGGGTDFVGKERQGGLTKAIRDRATRDGIPFETQKKVNGRWGVRGVIERMAQEGDNN
ncbi:phage/plasmid primase, P4 family [Streptomyces turgidiscabies]|uniref:phage/plasmid primase, P4 family n=1 Tax=Streptomyces turgidiscabies TaxID=85558 RepID=UPI0038F6779F